MNKKTWKQPHPKDVFFVKLAEEFGEVAKEMAEWQIIVREHEPNQKKKLKKLKNNNNRIVEELEHLEFIARQFRKQFERMYEESGESETKKKKVRKSN